MKGDNEPPCSTFTCLFAHKTIEVTHQLCHRTAEEDIDVFKFLLF